MSLFFKERRASGLKSVQEAQQRRGFGGPTSFMVDVNADTAEQVVAFDAASSLLADVISTLPYEVYTGRGDRQRPASVPRWLDDPGGAGYGLDDWVKQFIYSGCYAGNVILTIEARDGGGVPRVIVVRDPELATFRDGRWLIGGQPYPTGDVVHFRRYPRPGRRFGSSPIERHATTLGVALASERYGRRWFEDGAHPQSTLESDEFLDPDEVERIRARIIDPARGTREPIILGGGLKLRPWQVSPEESQFLATQVHSSAQACRILGPGIAEILGYSTGDSNTYKNRQELAVDFLKYAVDQWLVPLERVMSRLMGPAQGVLDGRYVLADRDAILRTDLLTRFQAYRIALGPAEPFMTANEPRRREPGLGAVPWGDDKPTIQGADTPPTTPAGGQP